MNARIVIAEDDRTHAELVRRYLEHADHSVVVRHDGRAALDAIRELNPDLVVLDVMLPTLDGWEICRALRSESHVPIVMLTARATEADLLRGLDVGADDYVTKPYRPRELLARIRAVLRRAETSKSEDDGPHSVGELMVDRNRHQVLLRGKPVEMTASEFRVLAAMARAPGKVFTRRELIDSAFGYDRFVQERTIDVHIKNLRHKIEDAPTDPRYVQTVYGVGYSMRVPEDSSDET